VSYLQDDLWLSNATHANKAAAVLASVLDKAEECSIAFPVDGNMIFAHINPEKQPQLREFGFEFYDIPEYGDSVMRLVTAFDTTAEDTAAFALALE
jgi:threonine aldolase